jgi:hypothetical protein
MRTRLLIVLGVLTASIVNEARADVFGVFWELESPTTYNLFATMSSDTVVLTADLGDTTIDLPPDGVNTGLFSSMGHIILAQSFLTIGAVNPSFARRFMVTDFGVDGSRADAAWYVIGGVLAQPHQGSPSGHALRLAHVVIDDGALLGGLAGGIQSRIYIGWEDLDGIAEEGVFNIVPAPPAVALLALGVIPHARRRRRVATRVRRSTAAR